jgi:hypothetical protein
VISTDGTKVRESCVCNGTSIKGDGCNIVQSSDGKPSPLVPIPTTEITGKASITNTGAGKDTISLLGGILDAIQNKLLRGPVVVVDINREDVDGNAKPGPFPSGEFAKITLCDSRYDSTKEPTLFLVEANKVRDSKTVCAEINVGKTVPPSSASGPNCWTFPVCHASTYATGTLVETSDAPKVAASLLTLVLGLLAL